MRWASSAAAPWFQTRPPRRGASARRVAAVGAEHEAAAGGLELGVQPRGACGIASIVLDPRRGPGALRPELLPGADLPPAGRSGR
jgi:hypothetical protein